MENITISNLLHMERHDTELYMDIELNEGGNSIRTFYYRLHVNSNNEVIDGYVCRIHVIQLSHGFIVDEDDTDHWDVFEEIDLFYDSYDPKSIEFYTQLIIKQYQEEINEFFKGL